MKKTMKFSATASRVVVAVATGLGLAAAASGTDDILFDTTNNLAEPLATSANYCPLLGPVQHGVVFTVGCSPVTITGAVVGLFSTPGESPGNTFVLQISKTSGPKAGVIIHEVSGSGPVNGDLAGGTQFQFDGLSWSLDVNEQYLLAVRASDTDILVYSAGSSLASASWVEHGLTFDNFQPAVPAGCGTESAFYMQITGQIEVCSSDLDCDGQVGASDLAEILAYFGEKCGKSSPPDVCNADVDGDGAVAESDIEKVLLEWGPCS